MIRIPENTTIIGDFHNEGQVRIDGRFQGEGEVDGTLLLTPSSVWIGKAVADVIVVEGVVEGDLIARKKIVIYPSAKIRGSITAPLMEALEGAKIRCHIRMNSTEMITNILDHRLRTQTTPSEVKEYRKKVLKSA